MRKKEKILEEYLIKEYGKAKTYDQLEVHSAFIIFENQQDKKQCLKKYKPYQGFFGKWK